MKKISVIIPVYNSETFIGQCIQSVIRQSYQYWEIIVIDDGSTDNSLRECRAWSLTDRRIHVFSQEHKGVSVARNHGIEKATGDYILFLDSDDAIHRLLMEKYIYLSDKYNAELIMCKCRKVSTNQMERMLSNSNADSFPYPNEIGERAETERWFHIKYPRQLSEIGGKMIRKNALGMLRFDENLKNGEDTLFLYYLISKKIQIVYLCCKWYFYREHAGGTKNNSNAVENVNDCKCSRMIRDSEYEKGNIDFALTWERAFIFQMESSFIKAKRKKDQNKCLCLKESALEERKNPLYQKLDICSKFAFLSCFFCYPLYIPLRKGLIILWRD